MPDDYARIVKDFRAMSKAVQGQTFRKAAKDAMRPTYKKAQAATPRAARPWRYKGTYLSPGTLGKKLKLGVSGKRHNVGARVYIQKDFFYIYQFLEGGVKPHYIKPKNRQFLFFNNRFVRNVNHPGFSANPWVTRIFNQNLKRIDSDLASALVKQIHKAVN